MATFIKLTNYKSSDEKEQKYFDPKNDHQAILTEKHLY